MTQNVKKANWILGLVGAAIGGVIGYYGFFLLTREGFYGLALPGALLGLGCGALSGGQSSSLGLVCCGLACLLGIFTEWKFRPFVADDGFTFFVAHIHDLSHTTLFMMALGGFFGYWFGRGREGGAWRKKEKAEG
jgi:uncharacterized membrane protein